MIIVSSLIQVSRKYACSVKSEAKLINIDVIYNAKCARDTLLTSKISVQLYYLMICYDCVTFNSTFTREFGKRSVKIYTYWRIHVENFLRGVTRTLILCKQKIRFVTSWI